MLNLSPEIKCLVKIYACSFLKNVAHTLKDLSRFSNISLVKIIRVEANNSMLKPNAYSIYIPENPHIKPLVNEQLWVSSKSLLINEYLFEKNVDLIEAGVEILKAIVWYISWNTVFEYTTMSCSRNISPFQVCVIAPNLLSGCVMAYPYLIKEIPVTVLLCADVEHSSTEYEISESCQDSINIIRFSDLNSTTRTLLNYTRDLGFCTMIICPYIELDEEIVLRLALGGISENGNIIISREIKKLSSVECSVLFQKKCTMSFCDQNINPTNWISNFVSNYMFVNTTHNILNNKISKMKVDGEYITKIENKLSFILVSNAET